ncbi:MAG: beta-lactamase family protein [Verrucomicrobia bacterium]|nr:beta-lactamase family protein [Verrucomicrobiota bacterium]
MLKHLLFAFFFFTTLAAKEVPIDPLDKTCSDTLSFWKVPGCAVAIVKNDQVLLCKGYGTKRISKDDPIDSNTLFPIASLTKTFTAAAIQKLVKSGRCSYDDPIKKFYPGLNLSLSYATDHTTIHDALSMSSGLAGDSINRDYLTDFDLSEHQLLAEQLPKIPFPKGFRGMWSYQNFNYLLAGKVFESTPQKNWQTYISTQILKPNKMNNTLCSYSAFMKTSNRIKGHKWINGKWTEVPIENFDSIAPSAGMFSCANDMAVWLKAVSSEILAGSPAFNSQSIASKEGFFAKDELFTSSVFFPDCQFLTYGYGWFIHDYRGIKIYHTPGLTDGCTPVLAYVPSLSLGIALLTNAESGFFTNALLYQIIDHYLGESTDWNTKFLNIANRR